ncbi:MAG: protein phosphatase 2C domain-containing protein [Polyangiaceae bacterium]|nr:protein phosphatase 2C domain-containing protein [Polyangiaceae bacterium]
MLRVAGARVIGSEHRRREQNAQDACFAAASDAGFVLVVSDGCGSTRAAEVGAALTAEVAGAVSMARLGAGVGAVEVASRAGGAVVERLARVAGCVPRAARARFVEDHLMATLLVVVGDARDVALLAWGDGVAWVEGEARVIDEAGAPRYLAHALLGDACAVEPGLSWRAPRASVPRIAIATDGLPRELLSGAFGHAGRGLPRWLNAQGARRLLLDDAAVALAEEVAS